MCSGANIGTDANGSARQCRTVIPHPVMGSTQITPREEMSPPFVSVTLFFLSSGSLSGLHQVCD